MCRNLIGSLWCGIMHLCLCHDIFAEVTTEKCRCIQIRFAAQQFRKFGLHQEEIKTGRRVAFSDDSERDLGAFMFYLDSRLETVSFANRASIDGFLRAENEPLGIVVPVKELRLVLAQLKGKSFRIKKADQCGRKSDSFRLVAIDPAVKKQPAVFKPKAGKPKSVRK